MISVVSATRACTRDMGSAATGSWNSRNSSPSLGSGMGVSACSGTLSRADCCSMNAAMTFCTSTQPVRCGYCRSVMTTTESAPTVRDRPM